MLRWLNYKQTGRIGVTSLSQDPLIGIASAMIMYFMLGTNLWWVPVMTVVGYIASEYVYIKISR